MGESFALHGCANLSKVNGFGIAYQFNDMGIQGKKDLPEPQPVERLPRPVQGEEVSPSGREDGLGRPDKTGDVH